MAIEARLADGRILRFPDDTDPAVIDTTVKNVLAEGKAASAKKPTQVAEPEAEYDFGSPMGTGAEAIMAQPNAPRKTYTGSVFDTQPFDPKFDPAEAGRLSRRAYAEKKAEAPRRTQYVQATPKEQLERTVGQTALDTTIGLLQGATAIPKGLASNINAGDNPIARFYESAIQAGEKSKSPYLQSQKAEREAFIKNVVQNQGELAGARATFNTMFSPAGADIVSQGAGSLVPTLGMSMLSLGQKSMTAMNALSVAGEAAQNTAQKLMQMSPENWSNSSAYQELRNSGMSHRDAVNMLAPLFAMPNQLLGLVIGGASGTTGLEKTLAGKSIKGGARERAGRAGAELLGEEAETLIPSFAANVTQRIFDDKQSLVEGLGKEAVETAMGTVPGAAIAASGRSGKPTTPSTPPIVEPPAVEPEVKPVVQERVEPTFDAAAFEQPAPTPTTTPEKVRADRIAALTDVYVQQGIPAENAGNIAARKVDAELKLEAKAAAIKIPTGRVEEIAQDLIAAGVDPQQAQIDAQRLAQEEAQADELAQTEAGGVANVAKPISEPIGESVELAGQPSAEPPAGGVAGVDTSGVVPTGPTITGTADREAVEPTALEEAPPVETPAETPTPKDRLVTYDNGKPWTYFYPGAEVIQADFAGAPAKVVDVEERRGQPTLYKLEVDVSNHPDGVDDNGDRVNTKTVLVRDDELNRLNPPVETPTETEGAELGTETTEAVQATQEGQEAPAAGAVSKGKRGRPPVQQKHVVTENSEGGFDHVTDGEVTATYKNKKQATAAVNLAKAKDANNAKNIAKYQAELDKALASTGRGRPAKAVSEDGTEDLSREEKVELNELESALETYNSTTNDTSIKNAAMYIYEVANDKTAPDAVRKRAQQMLEDDVDPKDVSRSLRSSEAKVGKADTGFSNLTNGSQAIAHIIKTGNMFQRFLAQRIRNFVVGVKFVVVEKGDPIPPQMAGARGLFVYTPGSKDRTIYVRGASFGSQQGINVITVLHELLHAATASRVEAGLLKGFKNASLQKFMREMESLMKRSQEAYEEAVLFGELSPEVQEMIEGTTDRDRTGKVSIGVFSDPHEFLAYGMSSPTFQKFLMSVQGKRTTGFSGFVDSIRDLFGVKQSDATAFTDLVDITDKMLDTRLTKVDTKGGSLQQKGKFTPPEFDEEADLKAKRSALRLAKDVKIAKEKVRLSREGEVAKNVEFMQTMRDPKAVREILANATDELGYAKLQASVRLPTFDFLVKWAADVGIPALSQANTQMQRMLGMSQQFLAGAEQVIGSLNRGFKEDPKLDRQKFADFVYATTLAEVDPSDPNAREVEVERKEKKLKKGAKPAPKTTTLAADYKALGAVGQRMYKQLRDYYESVIELYSDLLDEQINSIPGMAPEERKNLMAVLRKTFEAEARIKPFFPLVRRGDYWLAIGSGDKRIFYLFETRAERNAKAKELAEQRGEDYEDALFRQEFVQGNDLKTLRAASQNSSEMLKKIFEAIDSKDLGSPAAKEGLKDAIYQVYLTTMPEQSFRRQFTHRKGRAGFSTDLQRNIATTASKQSIQLARLKYAPQLRRSLSAARDSIVEREELSPFVQEAEKRIDMALSGDHGSLSESVAGIANKASYFWYLSSAASALIQPSSVFISGLPVLAGSYNDATGAATELAKMTTLVNQYSVFRTNVDGTTSITAPSIANSKSLPEDERKAISEMTARGVSESTYASLVWGYKSMSTEQFEGVVGKGKRLGNLMVGALMHNTERLSREAVYLAAYRLGKKQGLDYDAAVQKAVDSTNEALGNYDITNRPRFMQQGIGKIAFQFKTYPLQMSLLLLTNFKKMLPFLNKEGKKEAATKFFGMMGTSALLGGVANMALFSPIIGLVGWAWSQLELDDDWPEELKDLDFETWFRTVFLPEKLGDVTIGGVPVSDIVDRGPLNAITGYDIASRIGLNDLWGRDSKETKTSRESAIAFMLDHFGGPTASLMLGFADAYDAFAMGDYQKMLEKMLPAAVRNLVVANKYADEGMKTARGSELVGKDDVKTGELIGQAIGFRPDILAATQGPSFKLTGVEQKILNQRNLILNKLDFQHRKETDAGDDKFSDIMENEVSKFNKKYPSYALDADAIIDSLLKKAEQRSGARAGVNITEKNVAIVDDAVTTLEKRLEKREEEMKARREKNPR